MTDHLTTDDFLAIGQLTLSNPRVLAELTRDITALRHRLARANRAYCAEAPHIAPAMQRLLAYALGEMERQARVMKVNVEERLAL